MRTFICLGICLNFMACRSATQRPSTELLAYFKPLLQQDTLHIEVADETPSPRDTIPNQLFFSQIPITLLQPIDYLADPSQAVVLSKQQFALDKNISAYWVEIRQFWFQHHSLFLYDKAKRQFTDRVTVAEWYGGDGGQVLTGSWIFDFNGDGKKDIVRREIQHSIILNDEEPLEQLYESASLLIWKNGRFTDTLFQDTATLVRRFPIKSFW